MSTRGTATAVRETDLRSDRERRLELNEGQAVHSLYRPGSFLTGDYWDEFLVLPFAVAGRPPRKVAILGNAAGTTARGPPPATTTGSPRSSGRRWSSTLT